MRTFTRVATVLSAALGLAACLETGISSSAKPNDTYIPASQQIICEKVGEKYSICPELLEAMIERESSGQPNASNGPCIGLMQVNKKYHTKRMQELGYQNLWDEQANIETGASLLVDLCEKYEDVGVALMAYNGTKHPEERTELTEYAQGILDRSEELERIHGK